MTTARKKTAEKTALFSIVGNLLLAIIKGLAGVLGHSYALIADAIESTADVISSLLVYVGLRYSTKPADEDHPYGHGRIEAIITFLVVIFLMASAFIIAHDSIQNIRTPHALPEPFTLWILGGIILWKEGSYRFVLHRSKITNSSSLAADAWHHRSDAITSIAAFIGIAIARMLGPGFESADDWAALFACGFIVYNGYLIFRPAWSELMDEHRYDALVVEIKKSALQVEGILDTEKCWVRKAGMHYHVELHACVDGTISVKEGHDHSHALKSHLQENFPELGHIIIHIEPH
jgi:cation diffusion facilitator family transporter